LPPQPPPSEKPTGNPKGKLSRSTTRGK
jgi:hypothetical protein